jgi:predicted phosphodiesterase
LRYGVISDIHANLHALDAVLGMLSRVGVDDVLCAGDLVGYGPMPNECVARIAALGARCVAGNHDLIALGRLSDIDCSELAQDSLRWTRRELSRDSRRYLDALPSVVTTPDGVVVAHGSLESPAEYVRNADQRNAQLALLERMHPEAHVLILGHTHRRVAHGADVGTSRLRWRGSVALAPSDRYLLNPGSVGQSRERTARARFMVLDLDRRRVTYYSVAYDLAGCRRALRDRGRPTWSMHLNPSALARSASLLRRALRPRGSR